MRAFAVGVLPLLAVLVAGCGGGGGVKAAPADSTRAPESSSAVSTPQTPPSPRETLIAGHYQPLWPFSDAEEVAAWQRAHQENGHEAWHLDARRTATAFTRDYLGFTEIDQVVKVVEEGEHARVHVGYRGETDSTAVAAVVHLMKYGTGQDAPWEVVGTDDTSFSLTKPAYGATVGSPLTVGGRITGVDESITIHVRRPGSDTPLGEQSSLPAGGEKAPWSGKVTFTAQPGRTLTVVASTGGHIAEVERFTVTGVSVPS